MRLVASHGIDDASHGIDGGVAGMQLAESELVVEVERDEQLVTVPFLRFAGMGGNLSAPGDNSR